VNIEDIKKIINKHKVVLTEQYKVKSIGIFGSYARGLSDKESDIDILVEFSETPDIFEFIKLEEYLTQILGIKVDLVTKKALKPSLREEILKETVYL